MPEYDDSDMRTAQTAPNGERLPGPNSWLTQWANISNNKYSALADLALKERWHYGTDETDQDYPILRNYLNYTFKRLSYEGKILVAIDYENRDDEYAAFNTGLVDRKYDDIFALFKKNTRYDDGRYWYLLDFVVAGEDAGKTLTRLFNPLPERADYFENKIENMLYDTKTGDLSCDYTHFITERTSRIPRELLEENCPPEIFEIDGLNLDKVSSPTISHYQRNAYFRKLGKAILDNRRAFNRLKNRFEDAVNLALKRVEWNYKTAIPTYDSRRNRGSLLLPLALLEDDHVDLALVVTRYPSGSYQGETILPMSYAYSNSRLVSRPDSDWLRTEEIAFSAFDEEDEED